MVIAQGWVIILPEGPQWVLDQTMHIPSSEFVAAMRREKGRSKALRWADMRSAPPAAILSSLVNVLHIHFST